MIRPLHQDDQVPGPGEDRGKASFGVRSRRAFSLVIRDSRDYFSNTYVLKWSLWWALGMCGNFQVSGKL